MFPQQSGNFGSFTFQNFAQKINFLENGVENRRSDLQKVPPSREEVFDRSVVFSGVL